MSGMSAAHRLRAYFGEPDVPDVAALDETCDRSDSVFDWDRGIQSSQSIDVDVIRPQPLKTVRSEIPYGLRDGRPLQ